MAASVPGAVLPQFQGDVYSLQNRQALAQALMGQSLQNQASQIPTNMPVVPKFNIGAGLAQLGQALLAGRLQNDVAKGYGELGQRNMDAMVGQQSGGASDASAAQGYPVTDGSSVAPQASLQAGAAAPASGGMMAPGGPYNPSGMDPRAAAFLWYQLGPTEYSKQYIAPYAKATDATLMARAGGVNTAAANRGALAKANWMAPVTGTGIFRDPLTMQPLAFNPETPAGSQPVFDASGRQVAFAPIPNAQAIMAANAAAEEGGKAQFRVRPAFQNGQPVFTTDADIAAGGGQPSGQPAAGSFAGYRAAGAPVVPSLAPGAQVSADKVAGANADRYNQAVQFAVDSASRQDVLNNIISLSKAGVATGPNQDWINSFKGRLADSPGLGLAAPRSWKDDVSGFTEMKKFILNNGQRAWQAAGGTGTDSQLQAAQNANPNDKMFPQALQTMAQWAKAGELAGVARANFLQQFKNAHGSAADLDQAEQQWRNNFDPKVFQMRTYPPAQQHALLNDMTPAQAEAFAQKYAFFQSHGLLQ
jgi:hypothetical protein